MPELGVLVCIVKSSIPTAMGITEQWYAVAETVAACVENGSFLERNGCAKVAAMLDGAACAVILHRADIGLPVWYNAQVGTMLGIPWQRIEPADLYRLLGGLPSRTLAALHAFMDWQRSMEKEELFRFQFAMNDVQGTEHRWYACCGRLPVAEGAPPVILSICFDVDVLVQQSPAEYPAAPAALTPEQTRAYLSLSPRELQILVCLARGRKNAVIAQHLHISEHTVQTHRRNILQKLKVSSAFGLAAFLPLLNGLNDDGLP